MKHEKNVIKWSLKRGEENYSETMENEQSQATELWSYN